MRDKPPVSEYDLQAYADDRLDEERRAAVEEWLATRPGEVERIAAYRCLREAIRAAYDPVLHQPIPKQQLYRHGASRPRWRQVAVIAASLVLGALGGSQLHDWRFGTAPLADSDAVMAQRAAVAHITYASEVRHPVEVRADEEEHLVAWLSKRLGMNIRAPKLKEFGLSLVGGRLLPGETRPVALLMYQNAAGQRVTLYVGGEARERRETGRRYARENEVNVFYWIDAAWTCAVASADFGKNELQRIADEAYKQLES
jgi:anti-sigma factor RsiW